MVLFQWPGASVLWVFSEWDIWERMGFSQCREESNHSQKRGEIVLDMELH